MTWKRITRHSLSLASLFDGSEFVHTKERLVGTTRRIELPGTYTMDAAYHQEAWSAFAEFSHGFQGDSLLNTLEYRLGRHEIRGGVRLSQGHWYPSGGVAST